MKALIVSDSHGLTDELLLIKNRHQDEVDIMIHCGDSELEVASKQMESFIAVRGNCDFDSHYPNDCVTDLGSHKIFTTHGHLYNVKMSFIQVNYRAREVGASIVCFGHTHIAGAELVDGVLFINPGSIRLPRMRKEATYAILQVEDEKANVSFYDVKGRDVEALNLTVKLS
jgi:uncharacterized protein